MIDWYLEGVEFGNCSCDWCFPCEHKSLSSRSDCAGFEVVRIDRGHFGLVDLGGLNMALLYAWPGPLLEGDGEIVPIIDARASAAQRSALASILLGGHTEEGMTHWWIFHALSKTVHAPICRAIEFEFDVEAETARVRIPEILEATGRPTRSRHIEAGHRVRIDIPRRVDFAVTGTLSGPSGPPRWNSTSTTASGSSPSCATPAPARCTAPECRSGEADPLLDQSDSLVGCGQRRQAGVGGIGADVDVKGPVSVDVDHVGHDRELGGIGADVSVSSDLEFLLREVHDAIELHLTATDDRVLLVGGWDSVGMRGQDNAGEGAAPHGCYVDIRAGLVCKS
jgi:hypothetical protein